MMEAIYNPWPWYVVGPLISFSMLALIYFGKSFGVSSNLRTLCSIGGAGKLAEFFRFDWKSQIWNLIFAGGTIIGGFIANEFLSTSQTVPISNSIVQELQGFGISTNNVLVPTELFSWEALLTLKGIIMLIGGGLLIGFGTRYAGGCTSGHAISGLSNLQLPSLVAVIGFFIGGLLMTHLLLPYLFSL
ncbi:MAG: YeeE/YedE family protein [Cyclobacteriaceae bacterium]